MFNTIDVWLGNVLITERTPNQAFRAMVEIITGYGRDAAESWLQNALFFKDTAGQMDNSNQSPTQGTDAVNEGLKRRFEYTKGSKRVVVRSRIHSDLFSQPKPLINMVPLRLKFQLNKNDYCLSLLYWTSSQETAIEAQVPCTKMITYASQSGG